MGLTVDRFLFQTIILSLNAEFLFPPPSNLYFYQCSLLCPWCYLFCPLQIWKTNCCWLHIAKGLACSQYLKLWYKSSWIFPALHVLPNSSFESHKLQCWLVDSHFFQTEQGQPFCPFNPRLYFPHPGVRFGSLRSEWQISSDSECKGPCRYPCVTTNIGQGKIYITMHQLHMHPRQWTSSTTGRTTQLSVSTMDNNQGLTFSSYQTNKLQLHIQWVDLITHY